MANTWKTAITDFLKNKNEKELRSHLRKDWVDYYPEEKTKIFRFLYLSKQFKIFLYFFAIDLQSQILDLPWPQFLKIFHQQDDPFPENHLSELKNNFTAQKLVNQATDSLSDLIIELKSKNRDQFLQQVLKQKQELIASARIAKSEQLLEQHFHYMNELKKIAPNEYNMSGIISDQEKRHAEQILQRRAKRDGKNTFAEKYGFDGEEKKIMEKISSQAEKYLISSNVRSSDMAFLFRCLGDHSRAIDFIYLNKDHKTQDWQLLDYLFSGQQYLSLLAHCGKMKKKYEAYPDQLFSISYAEAIALWGLGEKNKAIDLMEQIASMRPDFKSATETLNQWKEDRFE